MSQDFFFGLPPFLPFSRLLAAFRALVILPRATAAGFLRLTVASQEGADGHIRVRHGIALGVEDLWHALARDGDQPAAANFRHERRETMHRETAQHHQLFGRVRCHHGWNRNLTIGSCQVGKTLGNTHSSWGIAA